VLTVDWRRLAVLPPARLFPGRLVAFEDENGYLLGLGIVGEASASARQAQVYTPLASLAGVDAVRVGDVVVDTDTFRDRRVRAE
jgi:polynucleotide 5'-kinase involved in rRNA processing